MSGETTVRYITDLKQLEKVVEKKELGSYEIEKLVDMWLDKYCNTSMSFSEIQDELHKSRVIDNSKEITLLFGRQLPTRKLEHEVLLQVCDTIGNYISKETGLDYAISMPSLPIDVMHSRNIEKRCYAEILMLEDGNNERIDIKKVSIAPPKDMYMLGTHELKLNEDKMRMLQSYLGSQLKNLRLLPEFHQHIMKEGVKKNAIYTTIAEVYRSIAAHLLDDVEEGKKPYIKGVWVPSKNGKAELYSIDVEERMASPARRKGERISIAELKEMNPHITAHESYNYLVLSALAYNPQATYVVREGLPSGKFQPTPTLKLRETMRHELSIPKPPIADFSINESVMPAELIEGARRTPYPKKLGCNELEVVLQLYLPANVNTGEVETPLDGNHSLSKVASKITTGISENMLTEVRKNES